MRAQKKIVNHTPETSKNRVVQMHNQRIESHDLDPDLLYISRQIAFTNPTTLRQALPGHWALFRFHDIKPNSLSFTSQLGTEDIGLPLSPAQRVLSEVHEDLNATGYDSDGQRAPWLE